MVAYQVVWDGRRDGPHKGSLLPDREERWDSRFSAMPSYDLEDPTAAPRKYVRSGRFSGQFSRTNPSARQYRPKEAK